MNNIIISSLALFLVFVTFSNVSGRDYDPLDEVRQRIWRLETGILELTKVKSKVEYLEESAKKQDTAKSTIKQQGLQDLAKVTSRVDDLEKKVEKQNTAIATINERATYMSAFSAGYDDDRDKLETGQVVVFRIVRLNVGDDYDETRGIFTAPVDGYYAFHLYVFFADSDHDDLGVNIVANGKRVAQAYVDDPEDNIQASVSTVVELRAGQHVEPVVSHLLGETYTLNIDGLRSGFTGYLIKQK